jgi:hypothetical protein
VTPEPILSFSILEKPFSTAELAPLVARIEDSSRVISKFDKATRNQTFIFNSNITVMLLIIRVFIPFICASGIAQTVYILV